MYCATEAIAAQMARYAAPATLAVTGYPASERQKTCTTRRADFALPEDKPLVIVVGGSSGAASVNRLMAAVCADEDFASRMGSRISILHQWGHKPAPEALAAFTRWPHYRSLDFHPCLAQLYFEAALFIGRAGAATIGELVRARLPAALIPYPHHADRQQYLNAEVLAHTGAAVILEADEPGVAARLRELIEQVAIGEEDAVMRKGYELLPPNGAHTIAVDIRAYFGGGHD
ncbi:MAG: hypothetical protein A2Y63_02395 [Candidatus Riflebacteria bacterium RBG_13_59_9]|nr:MAG: hypothetical protein A2Y63_02395 [Candidatus Riflebacteria bacterium RBG_13_59_9]